MTCSHIFQQWNEVLGWDDGSACILDADHAETHWDGKRHWRTGEKGTTRVFAGVSGTVRPSDDDTIIPFQDAIV